MRLPTEENPDPFRKPDNNEEVFAKGEFSVFIKPIFDTLDLYHTSHVDPRAIAIALNKLFENNPDAQLGIQAMEKRGDNFLIRLATSPEANRSQLSAEYFKDYNQIKALNEVLKARLSEKDDRIKSLDIMIATLVNRPTLYAVNYHNIGDPMSDKSSNQYNQSGNFGIGHNSGGPIQPGAKVAGVLNEAEPQNLAAAAADIQKLLEQLEKYYPTNTTTGKMVIATEAIKQIENDPTLMPRVLSAIRAGGASAFEAFLNHPAASFVINALQDWQETGKAKS